MYSSFVAGRYLRRRVTAYFAIGAVTIAVMVLGIVISVMDGFQKQIRENIRGTLSHISVMNPAGAERLEERIQSWNMAEISATSPRLSGNM